MSIALTIMSFQACAASVAALTYQWGTDTEASDLDYTILRPGWFTHDAAIDYEITQKGEAFKGHDVSLNSLSDLIVKLATSPEP